MTRPVPVPDALSARYWEAAARHELALPRCGQCKAFALPPEPVCPHCGSSAPAWDYERLSGRGTIRSWTVVRTSFLPGFADDAPFTLVDVELADQQELRLVGRLVHGAPALGAQVSLAFEDVTPGVGIPAFTREAAA